MFSLYTRQKITRECIKYNPAKYASCTILTFVNLSINKYVHPNCWVNRTNFGANQAKVLRQRWIV